MESDLCICYWKYNGVYWETTLWVMMPYLKRIYFIHNFLFFWNNNCPLVHILSETLWISNPLPTKIAHALVIHVVEWWYRNVYVHSDVVWYSVDYIAYSRHLFVKVTFWVSKDCIFIVFFGLRRASIAKNSVFLKQYTHCLLSDLMFMRPSR